jgi:DNA-binding transcriptional regulator YdaS (Cro superfamily)
MNSMNSPEKVIERKKAMIDARAKQTEIAREVGVCKSYVNQIILGNYRFRGDRSDRVRDAIARRLNRSFIDLWGSN